MIAAASRCATTNAIFVAVSGGSATDGMHDSTVSTDAITTKRWRGRALRRFTAVTSNPPSTAPTKVICANPSNGIIFPSPVVKPAPAAWATAANAVTAAAAPTPTVRVARRSGGARRARAGGSVGVITVVVMTVLSLVRRPVRRSPHPRTGSPGSTRAARSFPARRSTARISPICGGDRPPSPRRSPHGDAPRHALGGARRRRARSPRPGAGGPPVHLARARRPRGASRRCVHGGGRRGRRQGRAAALQLPRVHGGVLRRAEGAGGAVQRELPVHRARGRLPA